VFGFRPESCSPFARNRVRDQPGTLFGFTRNPVRLRTDSARNHQGKGNVLLFPCGEVPTTKRGPSIRCHERLGGLLKYYHRKAA
jgi:hypothetical protein